MKRPFDCSTAPSLGYTVISSLQPSQVPQTPRHPRKHTHTPTNCTSLRRTLGPPDTLVSPQIYLTSATLSQQRSWPGGRGVSKMLSNKVSCPVWPGEREVGLQRLRRCLGSRGLWLIREAHPPTEGLDAEFPGDCPGAAQMAVTRCHVGQLASSDEVMTGCAEETWIEALSPC